MLCVAVGSWWEHSPGIATSLIVQQNASEMVSEDGKELNLCLGENRVLC